MTMIRMLLADDQQMLRSALATLLNLEDDIEVVAEAGNGAEAVDLIRLHNPDVCVLDIEMPVMSGIEVAEKLQQIGHPCRVIILTTFARAGYFQRALAAGVKGYLLKDGPSSELANAIRKVAEGKRVIHPELSLSIWENPNPLTPRQTDILRLAAKGATLKEIGDALYLSHGTVRNYMSEIIAKLEAKNKTDAIRIAQENGWIG
jgi:two-component system response regulator DesR